jgi:hypothetical protein
MTNAVATYRNQPLEFSEFEKLDDLAKRNISFRTRCLPMLVWDTDEYGDKVQRRSMVETAPELFANGEIDQRLLDSLRRAAPSKSILAHFSRLAAHKPYGRGNEGWAIVLEDLCKDLNGISEYAVIKSCEHFRKDPSITFFPDTALLQRHILDLDFALRNLRDQQKQGIEAPREPEREHPTDEGKARVSEVLHNAGLPHSGEYCMKCKDVTP